MISRLASGILLAPARPELPAPMESGDVGRLHHALRGLSPRGGVDVEEVPRVGNGEPGSLSRNPAAIHFARTPQNYRTRWEWNDAQSERRKFRRSCLSLLESRSNRPTTSLASDADFGPFPPRCS